MLWTESLAESQVKFMNDIIAQVPEEMGARAAFIKCLQDLADKASSKGFDYYITDLTAGCIHGTDDLLVAQRYAASEDNFVVDVAKNQWIQADLDTEEIMSADE